LLGGGAFDFPITLSSELLPRVIRGSCLAILKGTFNSDHNVWSTASLVLQREVGGYFTGRALDHRNRKTTPLTTRIAALGSFANKNQVLETLTSMENETATRVLQAFHAVAGRETIKN
jgi:hypothetical protein